MNVQTNLYLNKDTKEIISIELVINKELQFYNYCENQ